MSYRRMLTSSLQQRGLSLVELMVALLIASFLLIGVTQVYIDNKRGYLFQQSQAGNQEGARYAELLLNDYLGKAGFRRAPDEALETAFPAAAANGYCQAFVAGTSVTRLADGLGLCLRYQPLLSGELDCEGNATEAFTDDMFQPLPEERLVTLAVRYVPAANGAGLHTGSLRCKNVNAATAGYVELLDGLADLRLSFGTGVNNLFEKKLKDDSATGRFKKAEEWSASDGPIRAVRYEILLASRENMRDSDASAVLESWLDGASDAEEAHLQSGDSRRIYQIARGTRTMRNLMP